MLGEVTPPRLSHIVQAHITFCVLVGFAGGLVPARRSFVADRFRPDSLGKWIRVLQTLTCESDFVGSEHICGLA